MISEMKQLLSEALKAQHTPIPWDKIARFHNILVHDYL
jgi:uncharacterized protein with HEPN domain